MPVVVHQLDSDAVVCLLLAARWEARQGRHARCCSWSGANVGVSRRDHRVRRASRVPGARYHR